MSWFTGGGVKFKVSAAWKLQIASGRSWFSLSAAAALLDLQGPRTETGEAVRASIPGGLLIVLTHVLNQTDLGLNPSTATYF